ncbi:ABC transporter substrate-binding protein [Streptosporangium sp. NPDC051022]|uniref:ABC transporter substrate-binding protein n=1 Tax=Streptosporangium sp. NPDC051022 TaxID=3155752 RepID=UPI0034268435
MTVVSPARRVTVRSLPAVLAITLTTGTAGCSTAAGGVSADTGVPRPGGALRIGVSEDPVCLDPPQANFASAVNVMRQLFDSLTDQDPRSGEIKPWLATSWEIDARATSFTFHLREGATFSDGAPVDARAVKANLDEVVKLGAKSLFASTYLSGYKGTTVVDARTARVEFAQPNIQFLQATATTSLALSSPASLARPAADRCRAPVGSGPFVLDRWQTNQSVSVKKRSGYAWGSSLSAHRGEAYLDSVEFRIVPEQGVRSGVLTSGQVDAITDVQPVTERQFRGGGFQVLSRHNPGLPYALYPNTFRPLLGDEAVRRAISKGIDREQVVKVVLTPTYRPATSILTGTTPAYLDQRDRLAHDPAGAAALLDGAGWRPGPDGIRVKDGVKLSPNVYFTTGFNPNTTILELLRQQLRVIGVDLQLRPVDAAGFGAAQKNGLIDFRWGNSTRADPDILRTVFSTKFSAAAYLPPSDLDGELEKQVTALDQAGRAKVVGEIQRIVLDRGYAVPVFELAQVVGVSRRVHGLTLDPSVRLRLLDTWLAR